MDSAARWPQLAAAAPVDLSDRYRRRRSLLVARESRYAAPAYLRRARRAAARLSSRAFVQPVALAASSCSSRCLRTNMPTTAFSWSLPESLSNKVRARLTASRDQNVVRRIWDRDASVWSNTGEDKWLGWLTLPMQDRAEVERAVRFAEEIKAEGITDAVLLGMGGSSMAPEVLREIIVRADGHPTLHVVDSTDPGQIRSVERAIDFRRTLFLVASKSGTTLEVNILKQYFFQRAAQELGEKEAGRHFVLTTDPGSKLEESAKVEGFRAIYPGLPTVGGRYSALSNFGLVP